MSLTVEYFTEQIESVNQYNDQARMMTEHQLMRLASGNLKYTNKIEMEQMNIILAKMNGIHDILSKHINDANFKEALDILDSSFKSPEEYISALNEVRSLLKLMIAQDNNMMGLGKL